MSIYAVVVTYKPDILTLIELLAALRGQIEHIVIVHNHYEDDLSANLPQKSFDHLIVMGGNHGIAAAHNAGIIYSKLKDASYVLLMDQDSIPALDMVQRLLAASLKADNLACVGPRYSDPRHDNPPPFLRLNGLRLSRCKCDGVNNLVRVEYVISSGCLIPVQAIEKVGSMKEELFIDYVDIEWGLRAQSLGLFSYGVCDALMHHSLGESPYIFRGRARPVHSPLRHYYLVRNAILLYKTNYIPLNWKIIDAYRLALKFGFYSLLAKPRYSHFVMMIRGLIDGVIGKSGQFKR
jgi:rhamnosyltransferase